MWLLWEGGMKLVKSAFQLLSGYFKHSLLWELSANRRHREAICWMNWMNETAIDSMNWQTAGVMGLAYQITQDWGHFWSSKVDMSRLQGHTSSRWQSPKKRPIAFFLGPACLHKKALEQKRELENFFFYSGGIWSHSWVKITALAMGWWKEVPWSSLWPPGFSEPNMGSFVAESLEWNLGLPVEKLHHLGQVWESQ